MRKAVMFRSVNRVLGTAERVLDAVYMWSRHRWMVPYAAVGFVAVFWVAEVAGFEDWSGRVALGFGGAAVAVAATTDYRIVASTTDGLYLFKASRIRHVAIELIDRLDRGIEMSPSGGTILATDWQIGQHRYTVTKSSEQAMQRIAGG